MIDDLLARRAERNAREAAEEAKREKHRRQARIAWLWLASPLVLGAAWLIYLCGYFVGRLK